MEENKKTIKVFCAGEQKETEYVLDINGIGEIVLTCECGRFLKYPRGTSAEDLKAGLEAHKSANEGQITVASIEAEKDKLIEELSAEVV